MRNGNPRLLDRSRPPFAHGIQRGTTIIRCSPPPTFEAGKLESELHQQYYDEVERRKNSLSLAGDGIRTSSARHTMRAASVRIQRRPKTVPVLTDFDIFVESTDAQDTAGNSFSRDDMVEQCERETCRGGADATDCQSGTAAAQSTVEEKLCAVPEKIDSPRIDVNWEKREHSPLSACGRYEVRGNDRQVAVSIVRGYIDIAHALLRHFEEALLAKQRLTLGSLQCAEIVCSALEGLQDGNPRLAVLVRRISIAILLLHRRKCLEERVAAPRDMCSDREDYSLSDEVGPYSVPMYKNLIVNEHSMRKGLHSGNEQISGLSEEHLEYPGQSSSSAPRDVTQNVPPPAFQRPKDITGSGRTNVAFSAPYVGGERNRMKGIPPGNRWEDVDMTSGRDAVGISAPYSVERIRRSCPQSKTEHDRVPSALLHDGVPHGAPDKLVALMHRAEVPPKTRFVSVHAETSGTNAGHVEGCIGAPMPFGEYENDRPVRPLVLSETCTLSDHCISQQYEDAYGAIVEEALSLIKCATDFILSGEGPEYVEKQFFRYSRLKDAVVLLTWPQIPKGVAAGQGKYILLRHTIALLEAEYGDTQGATSPYLYLRDLKRMKEILLGTCLKPRAAPRRVETFNEGPGAPKTAQNSNMLTERSPEERMERHLPLTILSLPGVGHRQEATRLIESPKETQQMHSELPRLSSANEANQSMASFDNVLARSHAANRAASAAQNLPCGVCSPHAAREPPANANLSRGLVVTSEESQAPTKAARATKSIAFEDDRYTENTHDNEGATRSLPTSQEHTQADFRVFPSHPSVRLPRKSGLLAGGNGKESCEHLHVNQNATELAASCIPSDGGQEERFRLLSRTKASPTSSREPAYKEVDGIKLSTKSVIRDLYSGNVSSKMLEAPKRSTEPPQISMAACFALQNISASRASPSSLPDIPEDQDALETGHSSLHD